MLNRTSEKKQQVNAPAHEPKSAHSTPVVEKYIEKRKDKAENQVKKDRKTNHFTPNLWRRTEYVIL